MVKNVISLPKAEYISKSKRERPTDSSDSDDDEVVENHQTNNESNRAQTSISSKSKKKSKKLKKSLENFGLSAGLKLTPKLINQLTETEKLYQSNLYKFQIQELLQEIAVSSQAKSKMEKWFTEFTKFVKTLQPSEAFDVDKSDNWLGDVKLPLPEYVLPKNGSKGSFKWVKPDSTSQIGAWSYNTQVYKISTFDIALEMPKESLNTSDYLNHKYHVKRAMYLSYLAIQLRNRGDEVVFICPDGNPLNPVLQIVVNRKKYLTVRIHCIPPPKLFKASRFSPEKNNLRFEHFFEESRPADDPDCSTQNYNTTILADMGMLEYNLYVEKVLLRNENFCQAAKLLKIWLQQRSLNEGFGSFSNFIMTMFLCYLAERKKINNNMSSYQIIRVVFVNLLQTDWTSKGITLCLDDDTTTHDWHLQFDVVFLDMHNQLNFTADMSKFTYNRVKIEAKLGLDILNTTNVSGFQSMFITKVPFLHNFDHVIQVKVDDSFVSRLKNDDSFKHLFLNYSGFFYPIGISVIGQLIEKCLKQRLQVLDVELPQIEDWKLTSTMDSQLQILRFGIVIQREFAFKLIEKCESEDELAVHEFKELWKEKSVLRRFRDGTMVETVTFENVGAEEKSRVCFLMIKYILEMHLGLVIMEKSAEYLDNQLERISDPQFEIVKLKGNGENEAESSKRERKRISRREDHCPISLDEITNFASTSFDHLSKMLRQLDAEGLPLAITSVQGISSVLRFSNFYPTPPQSFYSSHFLTEIKETSLAIRESVETLHKLPKHVEPIGVVVQLEGSGKWPDDINAIDRLKCAFLIRIGELLREQFGLCIQTHSRYLDVLKDGFVFRIRLTYYRELILLKQLRGEDGILRIRDNSKSLNLEKHTLLLPQLTSTLHAFNMQFGAFGKTCRLAKRWIASQLLMVGLSNSWDSGLEDDCRFTEEAVELMVAFLFLQYAPHLSCPNEGQVGFLRFLHFLGNTNWKAMSIIVNFNDKLSKEDVENIESEFVKKRDSLPLLFIATPEDKLGSVWTKHLNPIILYRASGLARQALNILKNELTHFMVGKAQRPTLKRIFRPDNGHFDLLIWVKQNINTRKGQDVESESKLQFKEYIKRGDELMPIIGFDPTQQYLDELRAAFSHLCLFLHDQFGGQFIAVVWKPDVLRSTDFKVSNVRGRVSGDTPKTIVANVEGIMKLFEAMGKGIVERVEVCARQQSDKTLEQEVHSRVS